MDHTLPLKDAHNLIKALNNTNDVPMVVTVNVIDLIKMLRDVHARASLTGYTQGYIDGSNQILLGTIDILQKQVKK